MRFTTKYSFGMVAKIDLTVPYVRVRFSTQKPTRLFSFLSNRERAGFIENDRQWRWWTSPIWTATAIRKKYEVLRYDKIKSKIEP